MPRSLFAKATTSLTDEAVDILAIRTTEAQERTFSPEAKSGEAFEYLAVQRFQH